MDKQMNVIEKLIAEFCPEGVEVRELGEVCQFKRGSTITKKGVTEGDVPVIAGGQNPAYYHNVANRKGETIAVSSSGAYAGFVSFWTIPVFLSDSFSVNPVPELLMPKYVFHLLKHLQEEIHSSKRGGGVPHVHGSDLAKIKIPIPHLTIQQEIVKILDTFTTLEAELEAELEARKKQYEYYRDELLTFGDDVEWKTLGDVCLSISAGGDLPENYIKGQTSPTAEFPYPIFANATDSNGLYGYTDGYKIENDAVTISARGAKIGYHTFREAKFTPIIRLITLVPNKGVVLTKYLNYILDLTPIAGTKGGIPQLTVPNVKKISIAIPPLAEQQRIVAILDKFDTLVNDISAGLPAELNARRKQYEYYRDKLLTFKPLEKKYASE